MKTILSKLLVLAAFMSSFSLFADKSYLYIGSLFPTETQQYFQGLQAKLKGEGITTMKDTLPNKMHITIKFGGLFENDQKEIFKEVVQKALAEVNFSQITVKPDGFVVLGHFAPKGTPNNEIKPRMILVKVKSPELEQLFKDIDDALAASNVVKKDTRAFLAHMTLGSFDTAQPVNKAAIERTLAAITPDDVNLSINKVQLLGLPEVGADMQYQDPTNYEELLTFPVCKCP